MDQNIKKTLFSIFGTVVVLWQLFASGYVLTLDMAFGPHVDFVWSVFEVTPIWYVLSLFTFVFGGWITQKILLIVVFFLLFYLPLRFFKKIFNIENTGGAEYVASLIFAINPFVYERFLAGQWAVLLGYALLMPFATFLIEFCKDWSYKNGLKLLGLIILIGVISLHILIISLVVTAVACLVNLISQKFSVGFFKKIILLGLAVLLCSSYWLVPVALSNTTPLSTFNPEHWEVFRTAGSGSFGTLGNVVSLHGFWGEHEQWISGFILPKDNDWVFGVALVFFFSLIIIGIYSGLKDRQLRNEVFFVVGFMSIAVIFSCGIGGGIFRNFNMWIFEHISFWGGFRDSEKWSVVIALSYALLTGLGAKMTLGLFQKPEYKRIVFYVLLVIPLFYTPMILFGFSGQLKAVQYPNSWGEVNNFLKQDENCRALFLPWHQYYSPKFNNNTLTANLSGNYFDCDIVSGKNMELETVGSQAGNGEEYYAIEAKITDNIAKSDATVDFLKQKGIKYIIFTKDLVGEDPYKYPFLDLKYMREVMHSDDVNLYSIF